MFAKLIALIKMFFAFRAGESSQKTTDHTEALEATNNVGRKIIDVYQKDLVPADNLGIADQLRRDGGL